MKNDNELKVLYVDDEQSNLRVFKNSFKWDFEVHTAGSAKEGLEYLQSHKPDVIITDQKMPDMSGTEFLKEVFELYPDVPPHRLILSAYTEDNAIKTSLKQKHLNKFVSKPYDPESLKETILRFVG